MRHFLLCWCFVLGLPAFGAQIKFDFNDFSAGTTPTNFFSAVAGGGKPGDWKVIMDDVRLEFTEQSSA